MRKNSDGEEKNVSVRDAALYVLSVSLGSSRAEVLLQQSFHKYSLDHRDRRLQTELVYGVIRNLISLDHSLSFYMKEPRKVQPETEKYPPARGVPAFVP